MACPSLGRGGELGEKMWWEGGFCKTASAVAAPESLPTEPQPPARVLRRHGVVLVPCFTSSALGSNLSLRTGPLLPLSVALAHLVTRARLWPEAKREAAAFHSSLAPLCLLCPMNRACCVLSPTHHSSELTALTVLQRLMDEMSCTFSTQKKYPGCTFAPFLYLFIF